MQIRVTVKPNSPKTEILEETGEEMRLAVKSKPEQGKANQELVNFLSKHFNRPVRIVRGLTSRHKVIEV